MIGPCKEWIERIFIDCYEDEEKHWDLNGNFLNSRKKWYKSKNIIFGYIENITVLADIYAYKKMEK